MLFCTNIFLLYRGSIVSTMQAWLIIIFLTTTFKSAKLWMMCTWHLSRFDFIVFMNKDEIHVAISFTQILLYQLEQNTFFGNLSLLFSNLSLRIQREPLLDLWSYNPLNEQIIYAPKGQTQTRRNNWLSSNYKIRVLCFVILTHGILIIPLCFL